MGFGKLDLPLLLGITKWGRGGPFGDWLLHCEWEVPQSDPHPGKGGAIRAGDETSFSVFSSSSFKKIIKINSKSIAYFEAAADGTVISAFESMGGEIPSVGGWN